ncbi:MAG: tRNA-dihydrouridine synthase family protein [Candidatus ainarchaeum sp.]|nr:tRNA-dihydrouridine synthase family protein [Candidatus ainarchaeum sp.]
MFKYYLAPMEDYTGPAFRKLVFQNGADLTFSEMTRVEGIIRNNKPTLAKIQVFDNTPVELQLLASNESQLEKYISNFKPFDGFKGFNLNVCCPSKNIIVAGRGGAMVKRTEKLNKLINIIQKENYSVSLKISLGLNKFEKENKVYLKCINETNANYYIVQCKYASQKSTEPNDYSILQDCVDTKKEIVANGGIDNLNKVNKIKKIGCKGIMIGKAAIINPFIFSELKTNSKVTSNLNQKKLNDLVGEYEKLSLSYDENEKYFQNFLKVQKSKKFE